MKKKAIVLIVVLLLAAGFFEWGIDRRSSGSNQGKNGEFNNAAQILDFLGGVKQYLAYSLFIKNDKLHHTYYGSPETEAALIPYFYLISLLDSHYTDSYYIGSGIIADQGRMNEAIDFINQGIDANPESADLYFELADLYITQKQYDEARASLETALQYQSHTVSRFLILRALAASSIALKDYTRARQVFMEIALDYGIMKYSYYFDKASIKDIVSVINTALESQSGLPGNDQADE